MYNCKCKCCKCRKFKLLFVITLIVFIIFLTIVLINNNIEDNKDILSAIATDGDNPEVGNATIKFSENKIVEGDAISHEPGSDEIIINESGIYQISYQLYGQRETIGTFNFVAILLVNNEVLLEDTINESPILRDNVVNRITLTSTVFLRLEKGDILKLGGVSVEDIVYTRARIDIEKIG